MHIHTIRMRDFRGLGDTTVQFHPGVNVLVGRNNTGKTTILDALRLCLGIGTEQPGIYVRRDDYRVSPDGTVADVIEFDLTWRGLSDEEKGVYCEMLTIAADRTPELQLHVRLEYDPEKERSKLWVPKILAPDFQKFWHSRVVGGVYAMWALRSRVI